ncbi:MAG: helix-turn-helix transcriptional regulator [Rhodopirellula sp.]|nr:helix-turn-helix transcriptional regulator [Rhodopirellula sp.]
MIVVKLRDVMRDYELRTGEKLTYPELARRTGLGRATIEALGSRPTYNTTLGTIDKLCSALECSINDLLEFRPE